jgi:hypothetical protein
MRDVDLRTLDQHTNRFGLIAISFDSDGLRAWKQSIWDPHQGRMDRGSVVFNDRQR